MISDLRGLDTLKLLLDEKNEHFFAPSLCIFLCSIKKNKELWSTLKEKTLTEENKDSAPLNTKKAQLLKTLKSYHKKIEQYCEEHNIEMPIGFMGVEGISEFKAHEQKNIASSCIINSLIQSHINALSNLVSIDLEFVKQFASMNEKHCIVSLKISPLIDEWSVEKKALTRKQPSKFWYAWKQLTRFHDTYHDFECLRIDTLNRGEFFEEWQLCEDLKKINNLNTSIGSLYKEELRFYAQQLIYTLETLPQKAINIPAVSSPKQSSSNQNKPIIARINADLISLFMCKKEELVDQQEADITFKARASKGVNRRYKLLNLLLCNTTGIANTMLVKELGIQNSKQLDKAINGINEIFCLKTNLKTDNLIVRKKSKIIINDKYAVELTP